MSTPRDRILDAAAEVLASLGLGRATTREIARAAGYSEAVIYKHFSGKEALFVAVLRERQPALLLPISALAEAADADAARHTLVETIAAAIDTYTKIYPIASAIFADPELLASHRAALAEVQAGPHLPVEAVGRALGRLQERGVLRPGADCGTIARLLFGAAFQRAFFGCMSPPVPEQPAPGAFAEAAVAAIWPLLAPDPERAGAAR